MQKVFLLYLYNIEFLLQMEKEFDVNMKLPHLASY